MTYQSYEINKSHVILFQEKQGPTENNCELILQCKQRTIKNNSSRLLELAAASALEFREHILISHEGNEVCKYVSQPLSSLKRNPLFLQKKSQVESVKNDSTQAQCNIKCYYGVTFTYLKVPSRSMFLLVPCLGYQQWRKVEKLNNSPSMQ